VIKSAAAARTHVQQQLEQLRFQVFEQPPSSWEKFQLLLGHYQALASLASLLTPTPNQEDSQS
jgi:hypothetical protein